MKNDVVCGELQDKISDILVRHKSILDVMTKLEESNARINRAIAKAVTNCGCININASKQEMPTSATSDFSDVKSCFKEHVDGELCKTCKEFVEKEIGNHMFYIGAVCNTLGIDLNQAISNELKKIDTLGVFSLI